MIRSCASAVTRVGGGVRSVEKAQALVEAGASKVIIGTAAYDGNGVNHRFLEDLGQAIGKEKILLALDSKGGHIVVKGWREATDLRAEEVIEELEPYCGGFLCTYVDKEGMLEGTDLDWYARLRKATEREITAAGGITTLEEIRRLGEMGVHAALGMAIYTGKLDLKELARIQQEDACGNRPPPHRQSPPGPRQRPATGSERIQVALFRLFLRIVGQLFLTRHAVARPGQSPQAHARNGLVALGTGSVTAAVDPRQRVFYLAQ